MVSRITYFMCFLFSFHFAHAQQSVSSLLNDIDTNLVDTHQLNLRLNLSEEYQAIDLFTSLSYANEALEMAKELQIDTSIANSFFLIGQAYTDLGLFKLALESFHSSLKMARIISDTVLEASIVNRVGNLYWHLSDYDKAMHYYREYFDISSRLDMQESKAIALMNTGICYIELEKYDSAFSYLDKSLHLGLELKDTYSISLGYLNLGWYYHKIGRYTKAIQYFKIVEDKYFNDISLDFKIELYNSFSRTYALQKNIKLAEQYSKKCKELVINSSNNSLLKKYYYDRYLLDSINNDNEAAFKSFIEYTRFKDRLNDEDYNTNMAVFQSIYDLEKAHNQINTIRRENELNQERIQKQRNLVVYSGIIFSLVIIIAIIVIVVLKFKGRVNSELAKNNKLLIKQKSELESTNKELEGHKQSLDQKNQKLENLLAELKKTQAHLIQNEKMASIGTLASGVAHEINNPLNIIQGGLQGVKDKFELLLRHINGNSGVEIRETAITVERFLQHSFNGVERAASIVNSLAIYNQDSSDERTRATVLNTIIDNVLRILHYQIKGKISITKDYTHGLIIDCQPSRMHQAILNIISNAIFSLNKELDINDKKIFIKTKVMKIAYENYAEISIQNNGPQIDDKQIDKIFDFFFTTKDPNEGKGLGLSLSYSIITNLKGTIEAKNVMDGVAFIIRLPLFKK